MLKIIKYFIENIMRIFSKVKKNDKCDDVNHNNGFGNGFK